MRFSTTLVASLFGSVALAKSLPPSPTASVGCVAHDDHWDCEGPASTATAGITAASITTSSEHPGPSPTESTGCEPHGDHWHCDEAATAVGAAAGSSSEDPGPSPTASVGCEPHGDHWHCDGPASAVATAATSASGGASAAPAESTGGAAGLEAAGTIIAAAVFAVALL